MNSSEASRSVLTGDTPAPARVLEMRSRDTTAEANRVYRAAYESLTGSERVERSFEMAEEVKEIALAGIRYRNPEFGSEQTHLEWLRILHGPTLAALLG